jgi:N-acetylglucosaminyl-diphospho-decaprenol L-rhamnosyltransferase
VSSNISVVVTHYKTPDILQECLRRINLYAPEAEIIVADNDSRDGTLEGLAQTHPHVKGVWAKNHSMADIVNTGLKAASKDYILQMNADVYIEADTLGAMLEDLQNPKVGMVGPRCKDRTGNWQNQGLLYRRYILALEINSAPSINVSWLSGCCTMLRREVLEKTGGLNSSFRFYNEDLEWSWRLRAGGYQCRLLKHVVTHLGGSSTPKDPKFTIEGYRGGMVLSQQYKPRWYQEAHRRVVLLEAKNKQRSGNTLEKDAYRAIHAMFINNEFNESPFGETLGQENERFAYR